MNNRTLLLVLAFAIGLALGDPFRVAGLLSMVSLAFVLAVSATQVGFEELLPLRGAVKPLVVALFLNFFLLGSLILVLAAWLMPTRDLWIGYVLVATAPPGIAIVPFSFLLGGNTRLSLVGNFSLFVISLLLTPFLVYLFTGEDVLSPLRIFQTMIFLVLLPFVLSQLVRRQAALHAFVAGRRGVLVNWGFFVVILSVVGLNRDVFFRDYHLLVPLSVVALASTFGLAFLVSLAVKKLRLPHPDGESFLLLATIKTGAFAAAVGQSLYSEEAAIPGVVISAWYALYFIYLGYRAEGTRSQSPVT